MCKEFFFLQEKLKLIIDMTETKLKIEIIQYEINEHKSVLLQI